MSVAFLLMVHDNLDRVAELAEALLRHDCRLVLHVDETVDVLEFEALRMRLADTSVIFSKRHDCEWGRFSQVEAANSCAELALETWQDVSHLCLLSGSCLPVKPVPDFLAMLKDAPGTDFIESVPAQIGAWVKSGLSEERFTLWFPFSWQKQRWLFDRAVDLQRLVGIRRKLPDGLEPHLGSQWWCLSRETLEKILNDPMREKYDRYFAQTWIPDESYYQSLARKHGTKIVQAPPTFARFDADGQPVVFYDEHAEYLAGLDHYFARKVWRSADGLYKRFLGTENITPVSGLSSYLDRVEAISTQGRQGVLSTGRFPRRAPAIQYIASAPYTVFIGFERAVLDFETWLNSDEAAIFHGRLYRPEQVELAGAASHAKGNIPANTTIRDYDQVQYLMNLIRAASPAHTGFSFETSDSKWMLAHFAKDPEATVICLTDQWIFNAFRAWKEAPDVLADQIGAFQLEEKTRLAPLFREEIKGNLVSFSLTELYQRKSSLAAAISTNTAFNPKGDPPIIASPDGFEEFLGKLEKLKPA